MSTSTQTTTTYHVSRDSADAWRDEDRAMAHASIASVPTLAEAQAALVEYIEGEVKYLTTGRYVSASSLRRAADLLDGVKAVSGMTPKANSRTSIRTANLVWTIVRTER